MTDELLPGLRHELVVAAASRANHRPQRFGVLVTACAAAAVLLVLAVGLVIAGPEPAEAGVDISVRNGIIEVRITDIETRPDAVEAALRDAGIDARVASVPVGPSMLGRFVSPGAIDPALEPINESGATFPGFTIPEDYEDRLDLRIGRPADVGEAYAVTADAYAPHEALSCSSVYGTRVDRLAAVVPTVVELRVQPYVDGAPAGPPLSLAAAAASPYAAYVVNDALALSENDVIAHATADGRSPFINPLSPNEGTCLE